MCLHPFPVISRYALPIFVPQSSSWVSSIHNMDSLRLQSEKTPEYTFSTQSIPTLIVLILKITVSLCKVHIQSKSKEHWKCVFIHFLSSQGMHYQYLFPRVQVGRALYTTWQPIDSRLRKLMSTLLQLAV